MLPWEQGILRISYADAYRKHMHIVELDRVAVFASLGVTGRVRKTDLERPTPCAGWSIADLLAHMSVQHRGFAAAARRETADWTPVGAADPMADHLRAAADVLEAFGALTEGDSLLLPEIRPEPVPAEYAVGFHFLDYVVHAWDVAAALGVPVSFDEPVLTAALAIARAVPGGDARTRPDAAFAPAVTPEEPGQLAELLALLGRSTTWRARYDAHA